MNQLELEALAHMLPPNATEIMVTVSGTAFFTAPQPSLCTGYCPSQLHGKCLRITTTQTGSNRWRATIWQEP